MSIENKNSFEKMFGELKELEEKYNLVKLNFQSSEEEKELLKEQVEILKNKSL